jgi:hypothetical protein
MLTLADFRKATAHLPGSALIEANGAITANADQISVEVDNDGDNVWVSLNIEAETPAPLAAAR